MNAFEVVTLIVCIVALVIATASFLRVSRAIDQLGRRGSTWFDHSEDLADGDRPSEDDRDAPIPKRPLRGRPE
jgi:hypothetical protein